MSTPTAYTESLTEGEHPDQTVNPSGRPGGSGLERTPAYAGTPAPAREATPTNHSEPDTGEGGATPPATPGATPPSDTEGEPDSPFELATSFHRQIEAGPGADTPEDPGSDTEQDHDETLRGRLAQTAERWGLDVIPPQMADQGLPPLDHARSWAERGDQAPATGPSRVAYRAWDHAARWPRYALATGYHVLSRPGRTVVALVAFALLMRTPGAPEALALVFTLVDAITFYTGLQWALGLT